MIINVRKTKFGFAGSTDISAPQGWARDPSLPAMVGKIVLKNLSLFREGMEIVWDSADPETASYLSARGPKDDGRAWRERLP